YFSSFSDALVGHAGRLVARLVGERGLGASNLVLEIASNDGYLLQHYVKTGIPVLGIEPASNIAKVARERGIETIDEFFGREPAVTALLEEERAWGVADLATYAAFAGEVERLRADLIALIDRLRAEGRRIAAYGAAAKGATLLNYAGIGADRIEFVADRNTYK